MMLEHLGYSDAAAHLQAAFESALRDGHGTRDVGGTSSTWEFTVAVVSAIGALAPDYQAVSGTPAS